MDYIKDSQALVIAGNLSANAETKDMLVKLICQYTKPKIIVGQMVSDILQNLTLPINQLNIVVDNYQLKKYCSKLILTTQKQGSTKLENFAQNLAELKTNYNILTYWQQALWIKKQKEICSTPIYADSLRAETFLTWAGQSLYNLIHNPRPNKTWQALVNGCWQMKLNLVPPK